MKLSVIVPTYNGEKYLRECLDSIINQTVKAHEIIVINDGSTDSTEDILAEYSLKCKYFRYFNVENGGQGRARNIAIDKVTGDHIMFIDSDDFIRLNTFEKCSEMIAKEDPDVLLMDYLFYFEDRGEYTYPNKDTFLRKGFMNDTEKIKRELLSIDSMFSVTRIYKTSYIVDNNIRYGEGYIYEDNEFWTHVSVTCKRLSMYYAPFYVVRINSESSTKSNHDTDKHAKDFIKAMRESEKYVRNESLQVKRKFATYAAKKFVFYYTKRVPKNYQKKFFNDFVELFRDYPVPKIKSDEIILRGYRKASKSLGVVSNKLFLSKFLKKRIGKVEQKHSLSDIKKLKRKKRTENAKAFEKSNGVIRPMILFMGFDNRYTGNSRYLFEDLMRSNFPYDIRFATDNPMVPRRIRIDPESKELFEVLYTSAVVIFESWLPMWIAKPEGKIWVNLWHGTPYKKMLFDSNEFYICEKNKKHKKHKFYNLKKMDYIFTDNEYVKKYFESAFFYDSDKLLPYGYSRVKYLVENKDNSELKAELRKKFGFKENEKIISYLPTWRDYNHRVEEDECDFSYLLNEDSLADELPCEYRIVTKGHPFGSADAVPDDIETQELLLISDCVVTDYSSVMFDAFALDIPVAIIEKDYEKYEEARGVYEDIRSDLLPFIAFDEADLADVILSYDTGSPEYQNVKEKYGYECGGDYAEFLKKQLETSLREYPQVMQKKAEREREEESQKKRR